MKYFFLNPECFFVKGNKKSAIYNVETGQMHWLEEMLTKVIVQCENGKEIDEIRCKSKKEMQDALQKMTTAGIGRFYDKPYKIEKKVPSVMKYKRDQYDLLPLVENLTIELTTECNLNCNFCKRETIFINRKTGCNRWLQNNDPKSKMTLSNWLKVVENAKDLYCKNINFIGGEPLLERDQLRKLVTYGRKIGINNQTVFTNGTLLDTGDLEFFAENKVKLCLQYYSNEEYVHEVMTGRKNTFAKLNETIKNLNKNGIYLDVKLMITEENWHRRNSIEEYITNEYKPDKIIKEKIYPDKIMNFSNCKTEFQKDLFRKSINDVVQDDFISSKVYHTCESNSCWDSSMAVSENGDALPCLMARDEIIANVNKKNIKKIVCDGDMNKYWNLNRDKIASCSKCEFRYACYDCRVLEKSNNFQNDLYGKSSYCLYDPIESKWETE